MCKAQKKLPFCACQLSIKKVFIVVLLFFPLKQISLESFVGNGVFTIQLGQSTQSVIGTPCRELTYSSFIYNQIEIEHSIQNTFSQLQCSLYNSHELSNSYSDSVLIIDFFTICFQFELLFFIIGGIFCRIVPQNND